jgi:hypothetical protein
MGARLLILLGQDAKTPPSILSAMRHAGSEH